LGTKLKKFNDLLDYHPEFFSEANIERIENELVSIVDDNIIKYFPKNKDKLIHHQIVAEYLVVYVEFIKKIKAINGRRAYLEKYASKEWLDWFFTLPWLKIYTTLHFIYSWLFKITFYINVRFLYHVQHSRKQSHKS
jgi:hypothetical protein